MEVIKALQWLFQKAAFVGLGLAFIGWFIAFIVVFKMHAAARVGKTKCEECGNEYFEQDTVGYHVYQVFLGGKPTGRDMLSLALVMLILALGVCSLGLLFNVFASFGNFRSALRDREWRVIIGFGIIFYRVLVLTLTLLWAYNKKMN